jgi:hypothetical protein
MKQQIRFSPLLGNSAVDYRAATYSTSSHKPLEAFCIIRQVNTR